MHRGLRTSTRADVRIREATEADDPRLLEIANALFPDFSETLEELRHGRARHRTQGYTDVVIVAEEAHDAIVGYGHFHHMIGQFNPGRYRVGIYVDRSWQRRGVGGTLFDHALADLTARGARALESFARETSAEVVGFLARRGFRETLRTWELRLNLATFDPKPFADYEDQLRSSEVVITTLAEEYARDPEALRRAYTLREAVWAEVPAPIPHTPVPFEDFVHGNFKSPRGLPDAYFLAKAGDAYIGEATLQRPQKGTHLVHNVTGVLAPWRMKGIAMALKLATITYGRAHGFSEIRTWNDVRNAGMLAINDRLGFVREPAWITFERDLAPARLEDHV